MSLGQESTDFEWLDPELLTSQLSSQDGDAGATSDFLKEGYLHVMEKLPAKGEEEDTTNLSRMAMKMVRKMSDPSILVRFQSGQV